jgi:hypothetical protein
MPSLPLISNRLTSTIVATTILILAAASTIEAFWISSPPSISFISTRPYRNTFPSHTRCHVRRDTKWDNLEDEDADQDKYPVPFDMKYEPRNLKRQYDHFNAIRSVGGKDMCSDVYVRDPDDEIWWYTGKVARVSDVSLEECVARQWPLIETHAANLRPIELFPNRGRLEVWSAPGDSELEVAYNRPDLKMEKMTWKVDSAAKIKNSLVGFQGEVYQSGEDGFRTWRTEDGYASREEINPGGETRPPTPEELEMLAKGAKPSDDDEDSES